jgi:hypothetical protein
MCWLCEESRGVKIGTDWQLYVSHLQAMPDRAAWICAGTRDQGVARTGEQAIFFL